MGSYFVLYIPQATVVYYLMSADLEWSRAHLIELMSITIAGRILKITVDVFMFLKFIDLFTYFIK